MSKNNTIVTSRAVRNVETPRFIPADLSAKVTTPRLDGDLLTERQAREQELPLSVGWYRRMRLLHTGPPFVRISNRVFYRRGDLREWIRKWEVK
jgi:hypothetical protein